MNMQNNKYLVNEDVIIREDDAVLFNMRKNIIMECNEIGFEIIQYLNKGLSIDDVVNELDKVYDIDKQEILAEVISFINTSIEDNLLVKKES